MELGPRAGYHQVDRSVIFGSWIAYARSSGPRSPTPVQRHILSGSDSQDDHLSSHLRENRAVEVDRRARLQVLGSIDLRLDHAVRHRDRRRPQQWALPLGNRRGLRTGCAGSLGSAGLHHGMLFGPFAFERTSWTKRSRFTKSTSSPGCTTTTGVAYVPLRLPGSDTTAGVLASGVARPARRGSRRHEARAGLPVAARTASVSSR